MIPANAFSRSCRIRVEDGEPADDYYDDEDDDEEDDDEDSDEDEEDDVETWQVGGAVLNLAAA